MIDDGLRTHVRQRAGQRCEYCGIDQGQIPFALFHVDHIVPKQHGGSDDAANLALACYHCNLHKGPNLAGLDPETGELTPLFNPRELYWYEHFEQQGVHIVGRSAIGRATVVVLAMNAPDRLELRVALQSEDD